MGRRGGPGGDFPLDNAFDELREVVEDVADAFADLKGQIKAAFSGGGGGSSGSGGGSRAAKEKEDTDKVLKDLVKIQGHFAQLKAAKQGLQAGGTVAQALGLNGAALELDKMAKRIEVIGNLGIGIVSTVRTLRVVFLPVLAVAGALAAGLVGVQQILRATTGTSITLKETFVLLGLRFKQTFKEAQVVYREFADLVSGRTQKTVEEIRTARQELAVVVKDIDELADKIAARGDPEPLTLDNFIEGTKAQLAELVKAGGEAGEEALKQFDKAINDQGTRAKGTTFSPTGLSSPLATFREDLAQMGNLTTQTFGFIAGGVQSLSATISGSLLSAFLDPQADIRQSFAQLFQQLAQQLLQLLIQALVVKAVSGITGAFAGPETISYTGVSAGGVTTFHAAGGEVANRPGRASLAHFMRGARGLAGGGLGRPSWIPSSDTVAAWLTPGEFVEPLRAVRRYGLGFMESIRNESFPVDVARAFSAGVSAPAPIAAPGPGPRGYASGGTVATSAGGMSATGAPTAAYVLANEHTADMLFRGGWQSFMRLARENKAQLKSVLG